MPSLNMRGVTSEHLLRHVGVLPEGIQEEIKDLVGTQVYGWRVKAELLERFNLAYDRVLKNEKTLIERLHRPAGGKGRAAHFQKLSPREALQQTLEKMSLDQLQLLCGQKNVSYESFMKTSDREGLVQSILDEVLKS